MTKPEQVKVCVTLDTGGVVIMAVVLDDGHNVKVEPTREYVDKLIAESSALWDGTPVSWRFIADAEIPTDRANRAAWVDKGDRVETDPARIVSREKSRIELLEERVAEIERQRVRL